MSSQPEFQAASFQHSVAEPFQPTPWHRKLLAVLIAIFLFEVGAFLIIYPWTALWSANYLGILPFWAHDIWLSPYFRGAISGLGAVNIYISFLEVLRLKRFAPPTSAPPESGGTR